MTWKPSHNSPGCASHATKRASLTTTKLNSWINAMKTICLWAYSQSWLAVASFWLASSCSNFTSSKSPKSSLRSLPDSHPWKNLRNLALSQVKEAITICQLAMKISTQWVWSLSTPNLQRKQRETLSTALLSRTRKIKMISSSTIRCAWMMKKSKEERNLNVFGARIQWWCEIQITFNF